MLYYRFRITVKKTKQYESVGAQVSSPRLHRHSLSWQGPSYNQNAVKAATHAGN